MILAQTIADGLTIVMTGALAWMINKEIKGKLDLQAKKEDYKKPSFKTNKAIVTK